jgi:hypothetical protein
MVRKSVRHRTIEINHQLDATIFQFIILKFVYSPTCFGRFSAQHRELSDCSGSLWFYLRIVVIVVLCSWSGQFITGPTTNTARLSPRYEGKNHRLQLQSLRSWWWAGKGPKQVELQTNFRIINWKIVASGWWFIWIKCKTPVPKG